MDIHSRIWQCRMIEKMEQQKKSAQILGLENRSTFHKQPVTAIKNEGISHK